MSYKRTFNKKIPSSKVRPLPFQEGFLYFTVKTRNLFLSLTDLDGRIYINSSGGRVGFKNATKKTNLASENVVDQVLEEALRRGLKKVRVRCRGFGQLRNQALRHLISANKVEILSFEEMTRLPHGGCRPRKVKRK